MEGGYKNNNKAEGKGKKKKPDSSQKGEENDECKGKGKKRKREKNEWSEKGEKSGGANCELGGKGGRGSTRVEQVSRAVVGILRWFSAGMKDKHGATYLGQLAKHRMEKYPQNDPK